MTRLYTRLNTSKMTRLIQHLIGLIVGSPNGNSATSHFFLLLPPPYVLPRPLARSTRSAALLRDIIADAGSGKGVGSRAKKIAARINSDFREVSAQLSKVATEVTNPGY